MERENHECLLMNHVCMAESDGRQCRVCTLLFANDAILIADSEQCVQRMVSIMRVVGGRRK